MDSTPPTFTEISSSVNLRLSVCSWLRYVFLTYCWVMVEPLWVLPPIAMLNAARAMPIGSTPLSSQKVAFSAATTAFCIDSGISSMSTIWRFLSPPPAMTIWVLSDQ